MPSRNVTKEYASQSYYHVYARGQNKEKIFREAADYRYFLALFQRYLSSKPAISKDGVAYPHFKNKIKLNAYCLMTNHFHLLVYQEAIDDLQSFMRSVMTSYSRYFNLKYKRTGSVFESRYKAARIDSDQYLQHITRYIHLNPRYWENYYNSSLKFYRDGNEPEWLSTESVLSMFTSREEYTSFVADYEEMRDMLAEMKYQLADQ
jgi:putative transposase